MRERCRRESGYNLIELRMTGLVIASVAGVLASGLWERGWRIAAGAVLVAIVVPGLVFGFPVFVVIVQAIADRLRGR